MVGAGIHGLILVVGFEVLADFFGEGAEIKIFGVIEDALVVAGLAPEFNLLAEAGYDDLIVGRQLNAGVLEQQGGMLMRPDPSSSTWVAPFMNLRWNSWCLRLYRLNRDISRFTLSHSGCG